MKSRYLAALNESISQTSPGAKLNHLLAERAAYLARLGDLAAAREEIKNIRALGEGLTDGRLTVLINLSDGLYHYYKNMGLQSRDRLSRAFALAIATGNFDLASRAAAWLALLAYGAYDFVAVAKHLTASNDLQDRDSIAEARNALTIAMVIHLANRFDLAKPWYKKAHSLAAEVEDDAMISAILHNMSSLWLTNIRNSHLGSIETSDKSSMVMAGVRSTLNFDEIVGSTSQPAFTPLMRAQLLSSEGKYSEALTMYQGHVDSLDIEAVHGWQKWLQADRAWCVLQAGQRDGAKDEFDRILLAISDGDHVDDVGATLRRISQGYGALGMTEQSLQCALRADECWLVFRRLQVEMLNIASAFTD
jgi:tetratricopeptide (TPR) repeat protein